MFTNEIILLSYLNGLHFPKCFGIYETKKFYFFIFEYFNGNFLDDFITKRKGMLNKSLEKSIIMQIESCFNKLKKNNIIIKNISSKCLVFSYYKNENNFLIKIFDYFINYIFFKQEKNSLIYKYEDFISNKKVNDEKYKEYIENNNYSFENMKPVIKDEDIEIILIIIKYKIEFIINYFQELLKDKNNLETEMNSDYYKEIVIFLYFCFLECSIIINFLNINADKYSFEISKDEQEIHLLKINLSEDNNYEYSNINFLDDPKIWYYNKENPSFNYFINIYRNLKAKIDLLLNKYIENNINYFTIVSNKNNTIDFELKKKIIESCIKEGNLEKLFSKFFENIIAIYQTQKRNIILKELNIVKYILEYIIFIKLIFVKDDINIVNFEKSFNNLNNTVSFCTFIGNKIRRYKKMGILNEVTYENKKESNKNKYL